MGSIEGSSSPPHKPSFLIRTLSRGRGGTELDLRSTYVGPDESRRIPPDVNKSTRHWLPAQID